jgi:hypothetical protein
MLLLPISEEIQLLGVADRGVPNKERVLARTLNVMHLGKYVLTAAVLQPDRTVNIIPNMLFIFHNFQLLKSSWVVIYTGKGNQEISRLPTSHEPAYVFHWGFDQVIFSRRDIVPALFRIEALNYEGSPGVLPLETQDQKLLGPSRLS